MIIKKSMTEWKYVKIKNFHSVIPFLGDGLLYLVFSGNKKPGRMFKRPGCN